MKSGISVGLIGDYNPTIPAHQAIPKALQFAADALQLAVHLESVPTPAARPTQGKRSAAC
jgi:CTP synthase (UTP-ammonia lyase)